MSGRPPIVTRWWINRIRLLGPLEIYVIDDPPRADPLRPPCPCACTSGGFCAGCGHRGCAERLLDLDTLIRGSRLGDMARAALAALVVHLDRGRTHAELQRAMGSAGKDESFVNPGPIHHQIGNVRRTGLQVVGSRGRYRVRNLSPEQVDVLVLRSTRERVRALERTPDEAARDKIIERCRRALALWVEDPATAHPYVKDGTLFAGDLQRYQALRAAYARALLGQPNPSDADLRDIREILSELERDDPSGPDLQTLRQGLARHSVTAGPQSPARPASATTEFATAPPRPAWLDQYIDYLRGRVTAIDLRPFGSELLGTSSLEAVYTPLHVRPRATRDLLPEAEPEASRPTLESVVEQTRATVIIGQPGSGKTTFLYHLCQTLLEQPGGPVPLLFELVEISDLAEDVLDHRGRLDWSVISEAFVNHLVDEDIPATVEDVEQLSRAGQVVWLLDGLNDIASVDVRRAVADEVQDCARRWKGARFVLTTTQRQGLPPNLEPVEVDEFRTDDIERFLHAFGRELHPHGDDPEHTDRWEQLGAIVLDTPDLRDLARIPLHLTAIALIYSLQQGRLPDSRADLLRSTVAWLIHKCQPHLRRFVPRLRDLEQVFAELAYAMMTTGEHPRSKVGKGWAARRITALPVFPGDERAALDFLETALSTSSLLVTKGTGDIGMHEPWRNYLAASVIAGKTDEPSGWWSELEPHLDDPDWRHVLTLVPGCLLALGSERVHLFFDRLGQSCFGRDLDVRVTRVALGGGVLRELTLAGYEVSDAPRWNDAVKSIDQIFRTTRRPSLELCMRAAAAYGLLGDDRLRDFEQTWAPLPGDRFWMGAQSEDPSGANYDPDAAPWEAPVREVEVAPFAIRKYPITVGEYEEFVRDGGYEASGERWWPREGLEWRAEHPKVSGPLEWADQKLTPNAPVTGVNWFECLAFCSWLTERRDDGMDYRLPTEQEWEFTARRGLPPGRQFSWGQRMHIGDAAEANWAGSFLHEKTPVGLFPRSTTPDDVADLFGNVEEWTVDLWIWDVTGGLDDAVRRVVRGGSCMRVSRLCRPSYRTPLRQHYRNRTVGFRPVRLARG